MAMETNINIAICLVSLLALRLATFIFHKWLSINKTILPPLPPGPLGYPIVGSLPELLKNKPAFRWIHKLMQDFNTEIACIHLGSIHVIPVTSPDLARQFLKKHDAIFASRPDSLSARLTSHGYLGTVLSPMGDQWKKMRRILATQVLTPEVHKWLHRKRSEEADHLVQHVLRQCLRSGPVINVRDVAQHYCANVIKKLVFGKRFFGPGSEDEGPGLEDREHVHAMLTILSYAYGFCIADYFPWSEFLDLDGHKRIVTDAVDCLKKYQDVEIDKRVEMWKNGGRNTKEDILDILITLVDSNNKPLLTIQEIKAQVNELTIAAVDNPSNAVEWAMAEMINQPNILAKAYKELDLVVGRERLVEESDLPKLNHLKACVKEAFRLHPVAPFNLPHVSSKDTVISGYFIPKGSHVLLSRPGLGRNPRVWDDPLKYKPERHIINENSEVAVADSELTLLSFSTGRRGCPAVVLGSTITMMLLARLIHGFEWLSPLGAAIIELNESDQNLLMAKPLIAHVTPRLAPQVYGQSRTN